MIVIPYVWLIALFLLPFLIVLGMSFATRTPTSPPFGFGGENPVMNTAGYVRLFTDDLYIRAFLTSILNAGVATLLCLLIGFPMALALTRVSKSWRTILLMLVILPFWTSFLLRVYAWMGLLAKSSWFNGLLTDAWNFLVPIDWAVRSLPMMHSNFAVVLVMVYTYLPFMILPLYASLERLDPTLDEAAMDLGSRPSAGVPDITLPQSVPGIIAGGLLVFHPRRGRTGDPDAGRRCRQPDDRAGDLGRVFLGRDWPMAASVAVALLVLMVGPMMVWSRYQAGRRAGGGRAMRRNSTFLITVLCFGFAFFTFRSCR
jgi:putrescine transport system permease protein